ncbi:MAG: hypothetical protein VB099_15365 [Candidatus Limiplasma sp.]|nr:hypothetical protein [Candidatus Limiplasma sp.]
MNKWKIFLSMIFLLCTLIPNRCFAESVYLLSTPESPQVNSAVVINEALYVMTNAGLYSYSLQGDSANCIATGSDLALKGISTDSLLCYSSELMIFDTQNLYIWTYENGEFQKIIDFDFSNVELSQNFVYYSCPVYIDGKFFVLGHSEGGTPSDIICIDVISGTVHTIAARGITQLSNFTDNELVAVRKANVEDTSINEIVIIDKQTASVQQHIAHLESVYNTYIAFSRTDNAIYTNVNGMLSRWKNNQWEKIRPMNSLIDSFGLYFAVEADRTIIARTDGIVILNNVPREDVTTLVIKGLHPGLGNDDKFSAQYPSIIISRDTLPHYCAEEVYNEIHSKNTTVDIFLVRLNNGLLNLMEKGYIKPLTSNSVLMKNNQRLYPVLREAVQLNGEVYALPYRLSIFGWMINNENELDLPRPDTVEELIRNLSVWEDHPLNNGISYVVQAYSFQQWNQIDYANYVMQQFIRSQRDLTRPIQFSDNRLIHLLEFIHSTVTNIEAPPVSYNDGIADAMPSIIVAHQLISASGSEYANANVIKPPALFPETTVHIPANLDVYIINPYSQHMEEAQLYLEYVIGSRQPYEDCMLYEDIVGGTMLSSALEHIQAVQKKIDDTTSRYEKAAPEYRKGIENDILTLRNDLNEVLSDKYSWIVYEPDLNTYKQDIVPYLDLGLNPYVENSSIHSSIYPQIMGIVQRYLEDAITIGECIEKLEALSLMFFLENVD